MRHNMQITALVVLTIIAGAASRVALSHEIDIRPVNFKQARPIVGESLGEVVAEPSNDSIAILEQDAGMLKDFPKLRVKIVGFTDNQECRGTECIELSLRRAKYVRDWFINHGNPSQQVAGPEGHGSAEPIDNNDTDRGRARNRRAEVQVVSYYNGNVAYPLY